MTPALGASRGYWGLSCRPVSMMHQQAASSHYNSAQGGTQHYQGQSSIAMMGPSGQGGGVMGQRPMAPYRPSQQGRPMCPARIPARGRGLRLCPSLPIARGCRGSQEAGATVGGRAWGLRGGRRLCLSVGSPGYWGWHGGVSSDSRPIEEVLVRAGSPASTPGGAVTLRLVPAIPGPGGLLRR